MNYSEPEKIVEIFRESACLNEQDSLREGNIIILPDYGQVVMTGDFHGCLDNFLKLQWYCNLKHSIHRHVIIHELIHTSNGFYSETDNSCQLLIEAAKWKIEYPEQVHFLLGNHDLAQITSREITKNGQASIRNFNKWIFENFGNKSDEIIEAIRRFLLTIPLAARTQNQIWMSHSLPSETTIDNFDFSVFNRNWEEADLVPGGSVYEFVWGRAHSAEYLNKLADMLDVEYFIVGHQSQPDGFSCVDEREIILASDHYQGCFMPIDLSVCYSFEKLIGRIKSFMDMPDIERISS